MVQYLIENGASTTKFNRRWTSALHLAAAMGHLEVVQLLVSCGADLMARNQNGLTPFLVACHHGHEAVVPFLNERMRGRDLDGASHDSFTGLGYFIIGDLSLEAMAKMLGRGADPDKAGKYGFTPLLLAAEQGRADVATLLIESGAGVAS